MKVAIYARVSLDETSDDKRFQDLDNQLVPLRDFCKAMGYEVTNEYTDKMSGANPARPNFRKMMSEALQRRFSGIIVWKIDRFSREGILPTLAYIKKLKERGIFLQSMTESWINTKDEGITEMLLAIMSWMASEERRKISERGYNANYMLKKLDIKKLYLIDPYIVYSDYTKEKQICAEGFSQEEFDEFKELARKKLEGQPVKWIYKKSSEAVKEIPKLDFVYIDGNHQTDYVRNDITDYYKKIVDGGLIIGHDAHVPEVISAVAIWCSFHKIKFEIDGVHWIIRK